MKKLIFTCLLFVFFANIAKAQFVEIPDVNFRNALKVKYPTCFNASDLMDTTCGMIVNEDTLIVKSRLIPSIEGVKYFKKLKYLDCSFNQLGSLPILPSSLTHLDIRYNIFSSLPILPNTITYLDCEYNQLTSLPSLPSSLIILYCNENQLTSLPLLPSSLEFLYCINNKLNSLPTLPNSLTRALFDYNNLTSLPTLPSSLKYLYCDNNQLTNLPTLPNSLFRLDCLNNQLTSLPNLPGTLESLYCDNNQFTSLPSLPALLKHLTCTGNPLGCLPLLPNSLLSLRVKGTLIKCYPNQVSATKDTILPICTNPSDICQVTGLASNKNLDFKLFPNPTNGILRIELPYNGNGNWILSDISGRQFKTDNIANGEKLMELNLNDLPSGTYFITIQLGGNVSTAKVIKM
ncbi:MAG: T9SS type A sorting domain-containing protein [Bacteroidetes bacterium]|nr:T9SS type A sorting domain-containing protein [Bacteroidota bacterium]